jgi:hypothetical protein
MAESRGGTITDNFGTRTTRKYDQVSGQHCPEECSCHLSAYDVMVLLSATPFDTTYCTNSRTELFCLMSEMKSWRIRFTNLRQPAPTSVYVVQREFYADNIRSC